MIVIQPLIQGLRGTGLYSRVYENKEGYLVLEVGKHLNSFFNKEGIPGDIIFGNPLTKKDIVYTIKPDNYEKKILNNNISEFDITKIDRLIDSCYNFEETHKVVEIE